MANQETTILCGRCKIAVEGPAEPKPQDVIACPRCGRRDSFQNTLRSVEAHTLDLTEGKAEETFAGAFRRSKYVEFTQKPRPKRVYPFISDLKL